MNYFLKLYCTKKYFTRIVIILAGLIATSTYTAATTPTLSDKQEKELRSLLTTFQNISYTTLIYTMYDLDDTLDYWNSQHKNPRSYAFIRGPRGWFGTKTASQEIQEYRLAVQDIEKTQASVLGSLHAVMHTKYSSVFEQSKATFAALSPLFTKDTVDIPDFSSCKALKKVLSRSITFMSAYKQKFNQTLQPYAKPHHVVRHWWKYILGAAAVSAAGYGAYHYQDTIKTWIQKGIENLQRQWQERIVQPIQGIIESLSTQHQEADIKHRNKLKEEIALQENKFAQAQTIFEQQKQRTRDETTAYYQGRPDINEKDVSAHVDRFMQGSDTDVTKDLMDQLRNMGTHKLKDVGNSASSTAKAWMIKAYNTIAERDKVMTKLPEPQQDQKQYFRLPQTVAQQALFYKAKVDKFEPETERFKLMAKKLELQGAEFAEAHQINFLLGAMFPAALTIYIAYKGLSKMYTSLFVKKVIIIPLRETILSIRRMLNRFDDGTATTLSPEAHGHLLYWAHILQYYLPQVPEENRDNFNEDIRELTSIKLTIQQKHETVKRMYETYSFLKPELA